MYERLLTRLGPAYIVWMMIVTRLGGLFGGVAVVYYVQLTLDLSGELQSHFTLVAATVVLLAVTVTVLLALWETRVLRSVMRSLHLGHGFSAEMGSEAGREAVVFPVRHHFREAAIVPMVCLPPVYAYLTWATDASANVLFHITIGAFIGISSAVALTYFVIERMMYPVVQHLIDYGVVIDYENLPTGRLQNRLIFVFTLIIVITAVMIVSLANQKVAQLVSAPDKIHEVVASLRAQTLAISLCAVLMALVLSTLLATSVTVRVQDMVRAMRRVEIGHLDERITAISTDEIGSVGRGFNKMVSRLEQNEAVIQELNTGLERKVRERTQELAKSKQKLQESYERLQEHDRLKTEFFSNVSHELRTPLTLILAPVDNMLEGNLGPLAVEHRQTLDIVRRNTVRLLNLINDLLDSAKLEAGEATLNPTITDLNALIDDLVSSSSALAVQRGIKLTFDPDPLLPPAMLDREKLEKVIINLLSNALKFTGRGGRVEVQSSASEGHLTVRVRDTGIGIAADDQEKVYQRFVQLDGSTSRKYQGTGLGLPLAKQFVELHGGQMNLESKLGEGSCFELTLPKIPAVYSRDVTETETEFSKVAGQASYAEQLAPEADVDLPTPARRAGGSEAILVVDDSPEILAVLRTILAPDYEVIEAIDGEAGLRLATEREPDVIISDVMMPGMDGYEFCSRIKNDPRTERIGFIMLTAKSGLAMKIEGLEHGADEFLVKPFNPAELRARVRSLLKVRRLDRQLQARNVELERLLDELKRTQDHLVHSEKMSSLGQIAAGIAHEVNNAINAVYNGIIPAREQIKEIQGEVCASLEQASAGGRNDDDCAETVGEIRESFSTVDELMEVVESGARRTADIVTGLKKFAHPGLADRSEFDVHEGLDIAIKLLANKLSGRVEVHRDYCDDARVVCSGAQLSQVFMNLLDNAAHAVGSSGDVYISTVRAESEFIIRIRDTGSGIPEHVRGQIFDPFFTTKEVGVGTGLGLSISYGIIKGHGGSIDVTSPPSGFEGGTEFELRLPLTPGEHGDSASGDGHRGHEAAPIGQGRGDAGPVPVTNRGEGP